VQDRGPRCSGGTSKRDDGQVFVATVEAYFQGQVRSRFAADQGPGLGAGRAAWPPGARLEAWAAMGRISTEVDFVGRLTAEPGVRSIGVVPFQGRVQFPLKAFVAVGYQE